MSGTIQIPNYNFLAADPGRSFLDTAKNALEVQKGQYDVQQKQADQAAGQAYQAAINRETGEFDQNEFRRQLAARGPAAMAAGASLFNTQQISSDQLKQAQTKIGMINSAAGALKNMDNPTYADAVGAMHSLLTSGALTEPEFRREIGNIPTDPAGIKQWADQHQTRMGTFQEQLNRQYGTVAPVAAGNRTVFTPVPSPAKIAEGAQPPVVPHGVSPDTDTQVVSVHVPGQPDQQMTVGQARVAFQQNPALAGLNPDVQSRLTAPPQAAQPPSSAVPPVRTPAASVAPAPAFQPTAARADAAAATRPPTAPPAYGSQGAIGQSGALSEQAAAGAKLAQQFEVQGQDVSTKAQPLLAGMLTELQGAGTTGFGSTIVGRIRNFATNVGLAPPAVDWTNKQASFEALNKLFAQYEAQQLASLGTSPSDSRQGLASAGSPSSFNTPEGNRLIIRGLQGNNDALNTMYRAWMSSNTRATNPGNFAAWRSSFTEPVASGPLKGARFDPTVFAIGRMDPQEQHTYLNNLKNGSPADYAEFKKDYKLALQEKWISPVGAGQ